MNLTHPTRTCYHTHTSSIMKNTQRLWLWLIRWPLAFLVQYGVTVEPDGDHDNKLLAAYAWRASYQRQVAPLSFVIGCSLYYLLSFMITWQKAAMYGIAFSVMSYARGWRFFPFVVIVSGVSFEDGDPQSFADFQKKYPGSSLKDWLFIKRGAKSSKFMRMYSKARLHQFGHELQDFMKMYGAHEGQYVLVSGYTDQAQHFVSPEACFRASALEDCRNEKGPFEKYKKIVYSEWTDHVNATVRRWLHSNPYDTTFERWCHEKVYYNQWLCLISGGPLSEVAYLCELSNNVVSYAMAWSWDTSKNLFGQNANVLFDVDAAVQVVERAWVHVGVDTNFVKQFCPRFLGENRVASFLEFKKQMGGRVDPETEIMYRHFTELGGPTPWNQIPGGYGTFYIYDLYAAILALEGGGVYKPAVVRHRVPAGNYMHDRGKVDVHPTNRYTRFYVTAPTLEKVHSLRTHLINHMKWFFSNGTY